MITLKNVLEWLKMRINGNIWRTSKGDFTYDKSITIYDRKSVSSYRSTNVRKYKTKAITILVHWGKNPSEAEAKAYEVYNIFDSKDETEINGISVITALKNDQPVFIGVDDSGVIEYVIDVDILYKI